ncbi:MAG: hypothetical protein R3C45_04300 [Phycisphaerales bacterium]
MYRTCVKPLVVGSLLCAVSPAFAYLGSFELSDGYYRPQYAAWPNGGGLTSTRR